MQKIKINESKHTTIENHQITKKGGRMEEGNKETIKQSEYNEEKGNSKSTSTTNYFQYK